MDTRAEAGYAASWTTEGTSGEKTVTEAEWMACTNTSNMLSYLCDQRRLLQFKNGRRKARLLACAWCRPLTVWLSEDWGCRALEAVEKYADGLIGKEELAVTHREVLAAQEAARIVPRDANLTEGEAEEALCEHISYAAWALSGLTLESSTAVLYNVLYPRTHATKLDSHLPDTCDSVREVVGNPFRPARLLPVQRKWNDGTLVKMARVIYDERRFSDLPILADALEEAGCRDQDILAHCRSGGEHVRGCWAVDLILSKDRSSNNL